MTLISLIMLLGAAGFSYFIVRFLLFPIASYIFMDNFRIFPFYGNPTGEEWLIFIILMIITIIPVFYLIYLKE